jgi:hypothetical protein
MVLVCDSPKPAKPQTQKERKVDLAKYADLMEKIFGYSVKSTLGDDELTLSVAPKSQSGVPFSVQQQTYFIKRVKDQLYVTVTTEISDADSFLGSVFLLAPVDADQSKEIVAKIEELTHAEAGKCKII